MNRDLSETVLSNMPDRKFKVIIIWRLTGLEKRVEYMNETLSQR